MFKVTKADFKEFQDLQKLGIINMLDKQVQSICGFDKETHFAIIQFYEHYEQEFKNK